MQGKETLLKLWMPLEWGMPCGGMKMRNESQVGFNQNYQPKKNNNFEKNECTGKEKMMVQVKK